MNEEETQEANDSTASGERKEVSNENTGNGTASEQVGKVRQDLEALKTANDEVEKELLRKEELRAKMALGGQTEAGQEPIKAKEETPKEYRERIEKEIQDGKHND